MILDSCHSSMPSVGAIMRLRKYESTLAHSRARCFSVWENIDINKLLDALWGIVHVSY